MAHKKTHMFKLTPHVGNAWNRIEQDPDADMQEAQDIARMADLRNAKATAEYKHQQMVARMKANVAQFKQAMK
jgi:hypothetical protein